MLEREGERERARENQRKNQRDTEEKQTDRQTDRQKQVIKTHKLSNGNTEKLILCKNIV